MKKKGIYGVLIGALAMGLLTGCGDGSEENGTTVPSKIEEITAEPLISDTERELMNYEQKYSTGEFTMEDYQALANLYGEAGFVRKQRDMLEQSYRLHQDAQSFEILQTIA